MRTKALCLMLAGLFAGLYAVANLCRTGIINSASNMTTISISFDAMMSCFIGVAISFNKNLVIGMFSGSLVMQIVKLFILVLGIPTQFNHVVTATMIVIFMIFSENPWIGEWFKGLFTKKQ